MPEVVSKKKSSEYQRTTNDRHCTYLEIKLKIFIFNNIQFPVI